MLGDVVANALWACVFTLELPYQLGQPCCPQHYSLAAMLPNTELMLLLFNSHGLKVNLKAPKVQLPMQLRKILTADQTCLKSISAFCKQDLLGLRRCWPWKPQAELVQAAQLIPSKRAWASLSLFKEPRLKIRLKAMHNMKSKKIPKLTR